MNKFFLTIFAVLFFSSAQAADKACSTPVFLYIYIQNDPALPELTCNDIIPFIQTYANLSQLSPYPLDLPSLLIFNHSINQGMNYEFRPSLFNVGVFADGHDILGVSWLFAHEIGHQIFYAHLLENSSAYKPLLKKRSEFNTKMLEAKKIKKTSEIINDPDLQNYYAFNHREVALPMVLITERIAASYQELFADIVAAIYLNEPEYNQKIGSRLPLPFSSGEYRSFTVNQPVTIKTATDPYYYFASVRADIWNQWVVPRLEDKPKLLKELAEVFSAEIQRRIEANEPEASQITTSLVIEWNKKNSDELLKALGVTRD